MTNYFEEYSLDESHQLLMKFHKECSEQYRKIFDSLFETQNFLTTDCIHADLWCNYYVSSASESTKPESSLARIKPGTPFIADGESHESICTLQRDSHGYTKLDESIIRNKTTNNIQFIKYPTECLRAKVSEINDNSITAEVYYDDHESEVEFSAIFKEILDDVDLLELGTIFEIITEQHRGGFSVDVRAVNESLDEDDAILFQEIMKAKINKC